MTISRSWSGIYVDHPVRPVGAQDLLLGLDQVNVNARTRRDTISRSAPPHIGFACQWEDPPERTWSGSASNLLTALRGITQTTDIGVRIPSLALMALRASHIRYRGRRLTSTWSVSRVTDAYNSRALRRTLARSPEARGCDAVLMIDDIAVLPVPFFSYYDSSWDSRLSALDSIETYASLAAVSPSTLERRRQRQHALYERATGVIAMSHWLARSLVEQSGLPPTKVHVVHPGISAGWAVHSGVADEKSDHRGLRCIPERPAPRRRLLFVGRQYREHDFYRKGGDLAVPLPTASGSSGSYPATRLQRFTTATTSS